MFNMTMIRLLYVLLSITVTLRASPPLRCSTLDGLKDILRVACLKDLVCTYMYNLIEEPDVFSYKIDRLLNLVQTSSKTNNDTHLFSHFIHLIWDADIIEMTHLNELGPYGAITVTDHVDNCTLLALDSNVTVTTYTRLQPIIQALVYYEAFYVGASRCGSVNELLVMTHTGTFTCACRPGKLCTKTTTNSTLLKAVAILTIGAIGIAIVTSTFMHMLYITRLSAQRKSTLSKILGDRR